MEKPSTTTIITIGIVLIFIVAIVFMFVSGPMVQPTRKRELGLSIDLTPDIKEVQKSSPVTFIASIKNLADEEADDITIRLHNLTGWKIENSYQTLDKLSPEDTHKFSWIAYSPSISKAYHAAVKLSYEMQTKSSLEIRIYDNDYLNTLEKSERDRIKSKSALQSYSTSEKTPVDLTISLKQPFILTSKTQEFPFVINLENKGLGNPYYGGHKDKLKFSYSSDYDMECDVSNNAIIVVDRSRSVVCRLIAEKEDVGNYLDVVANFTLKYTYKDEVSTTVEVV